MTFSQLQAFLLSLGFEQPVQADRSQAFRHPSSGTVLVVTSQKDNERLRPADVLSLLVRLEHAGLANAAQLQEIRQGRLPKAS